MATMKAMHSTLDEEWIQLILAARALGITIEEIKEFLSSSDSFVLKDKEMIKRH